MTFSRWLPLTLFLLLAFAAASIGSFATASNSGLWYSTLHKPAWNPPSWLFAPVWTLLYVAMGVAVWRVWRNETPVESRRTFRLYSAQLALNALWSVLFFGLRQPGWALAEVIVFWLVLVRILCRFWSADRVARWLWIPYVLWVTFAAALNAAVWQLNR